MAAATARQFSYAPEDPTLPKPWKGLVDGRTGYLYFWNTETNVTQYERPVVKCDAFQTVLKAAGTSTEVERSVREGGGDDGPPGGSRNADSNYQVPGESTHYSQIQPASLAMHSSSDSQGNLSSESYRRQHEITVLGGDVPAPLMTWDATGFPSEVLREIRSAGFSTPTPIQAQSWPIAMRGRDIVAVAKTGSGKTLGFLFPGFMHLSRLRNNPKIGPTVLVLSPTRELATQILAEAVKFGKSSRLSCTCLYGGAPKGPQLRDIERGVDVVVATPGRLNDILEMRRISLHQVSYLVLDEADRMLDMGFEPQIRKIVKEIPSSRQTLMFTATWPKGVRKIATDLLINPVQVNIGNVDELVANKAITQYVEVISSMEKRRRLEQILRSQEPGSKIIIFCSTKRMCDMLVQGLANKVGAAAIHGDKSQAERDQVLSQFRSGRSPVLVATDVAARGLDVKDIRIVINYDFPTGVEDYVHRIGRTGRGGATGVSYTFFCDQDAKYAADLIRILEGANQQVPPELRDMSSRGGGGGYGKFSRWGSGSNTGGRSYGGKNDAAYGRSQDNVEHSYGRYEGGGSCHRQDNHAGYGGGYQNSSNQDSRGSWANNDNRGGGSYVPYPEMISIRDQSPPTRSRSRSRSPTFRHADTAPSTRGWSAHDSEISTTPSLSCNADNLSRCVVPSSEEGVGPSTTIQ